MKWIFIPLTVFPLLSFAQVAPMEKDINLTITASGTLTSGKKFESIGVATFTGLENTLASRGGFASAYKEFKSQNQITYGVWQETEAFRAFLKDCNIEAPSDLLAMRIGLDKIFSSKNDSEVNQVLTDLAPNLSFEKKIEFASRIGGVLLDGYDDARAAKKTGGAITFREMITRKQQGLPAGVCRDMAQAMAMSLKQMGVDGAYVVAYQTAGGGHATVLAQDPKNPSKTFNINYGFVTSTESTSALSHLQQDNTIPSVGTDMKIYNAEGKMLTTLPTHLGVALHEIAGGSAKDIDPLLQSDNQVLNAQYKVSDNVTVGAGVAVTPDGDKIAGVTASYFDLSKNFPLSASVVIYNNERETDLRGDLKSTGIFMEAEQRFISNPLTVKTGHGKLAMNIEGKIRTNSNVSFNSLSGSWNNKRTISMGTDVSASVGSRAGYSSDDGRTQIVTHIEATGGIAKGDVRDESSTTFDLRHISGSAHVKQKIGPELEAQTGATVVIRPGLGTQANQQIGLVKKNKDGSITGLVVTHEGSVAGRSPVFVPGATETYRLDLRHQANHYAVDGGVYCRKLDESRRDCGVRTTATLKLGPGKKN